MKQNYKTLITYASIIFGVVAVAGGIIAYAQTKQEPIQEILNQIQMNESELQQIETRADELNKANEEAKSRLLNEYGLQISELKKTDYDVKWCSRAYDVSARQIRDGVSTAEIQREVLEEEGCPESYKERLYEIGEERTPGKLNASGDAQEMPIVEGNDSHERFKSLATAYGLDASQIRTVENHYGIKEGVILCITVAETSGGNRGYGSKNIGSVGSNDRGDRPTYALMEAGLEAIGKTLNNQYLGSKKTLGCLSNAGSCNESNDNGKRYATSESSREKNMVACLSTIYGSVNASTFGIRR